MPQTLKYPGTAATLQLFQDSSKAWFLSIMFESGIGHVIPLRELDALVMKDAGVEITKDILWPPNPITKPNAI